LSANPAATTANRLPISFVICFSLHEDVKLPEAT
jgi:hypothetical protein